MSEHQSLWELGSKAKQIVENVSQSKANDYFIDEQMDETFVRNLSDDSDSDSSDTDTALSWLLAVISFKNLLLKCMTTIKFTKEERKNNKRQKKEKYQTYEKHDIKKR